MRLRNFAEARYWLHLKLHQIVGESEAGQVFLSIKLEVFSKVPLRATVSGFSLIVGVPRDGVPWIAVCYVLVDVEEVVVGGSSLLQNCIQGHTT